MSRRRGRFMGLRVRACSRAVDARALIFTAMGADLEDHAAVAGVALRRRCW